MTLKIFIWKSREFFLDSRRVPDLHRFWVPQLTSATCERKHSLLSRAQQLRKLEENGCSPVWCDADSSCTQLLRSHLRHQTHPRINEGSIVEKVHVY